MRLQFACTIELDTNEFDVEVDCIVDIDPPDPSVGYFTASIAGVQILSIKDESGVVITGADHLVEEIAKDEAWEQYQENQQERRCGRRWRFA